jgi:hypothetical protein
MLCAIELLLRPLERLHGSIGGERRECQGKNDRGYESNTKQSLHRTGSPAGSRVDDPRLRHHGEARNGSVDVL